MEVSMAARDRALFNLRFEHKPGAASRWADETDPRKRFWRPYLDLDRPGEPDLHAELALENSVIQGPFASALAGKVVQAAGTRSGVAEGSSKGADNRNLQRLSQDDFNFAVVGPIRYGSAEVSVLLEGASRVARAFDNNFELFRLALETYAPEAWNLVVPAAPVPLLCVLKDDQVLRAAFEPESSMAATDSVRGEEEKARRLRWLWIAANTSLVVPCLLALAVLYIASEHLFSLEGAVAERTSQIQAREVELVKAYQARERDLHSVLIEAAKSASSRGAEQSCCCTAVPKTKTRTAKGNACIKRSEPASAPRS
jgi:hypothetical protein